MKKDKITCIVVDFERKPKIVKIEKSLEAYQAAVGGYIEVLYPFTDSVGIVCNEEGKMLHLAPNRALYTQGEFVTTVNFMTFSLESF